MQSINFLLIPVGSLGDVLPMLAVGDELKSRGHDVCVLSSPKFREQIEKREQAFFPIGQADEFKKISQDPALQSAARSWKPALRWGALGKMHATFDAIENLAGQSDKPTVVVAPGMSFGARIAREVLDIKLATIHLEPMKFRSVYQSPVMPPMYLPDWMPSPLKAIQYWFADRFVIDRVLYEETNRFRRSKGLEKPVRRFLHRWWNSEDLVLGMFPDWFARPQKDWPANTVLPGFPLTRNQQSVDDEVLDFLERNPSPLVFITNSADRNRLEFYQQGVEVCQQLGRPGILLGGVPGQIRKLPDSIYHSAFVPLAELLPKAAVLVHRAGIGVTALALQAGIPQVVLPIAFSQPDTARRILKLNVGRVVRKTSTKSIAKTIKSVLADPSIVEQCQVFQNRLTESDGLRQTGDLLESLI